MSLLDRFLLLTRAPHARSRVAYRLLLAIVALERTGPRAAVPVRASTRPRRH